MREMIAMLDGLGDLGSYRMEVVSPSQGANYQGGSSWAPGLPTYPSSNGLAGAQRGLADVVYDAISPSQGANYQGGSSWAPGLPLYPSSHGLAEYMASLSPEERRMMARDVVSASQGANYSGGSSWAPGLPTYPSSSGLAAPMSPRMEWRVFLRTKAADIKRADRLQRLSRAMMMLWSRAAPFCYQPPAAPPSPSLPPVSDLRSLERALAAYKAHVMAMSALYGRYISSCTSIPPATVRNMRAAMRMASEA
ncbi:MAG: hypothetical protein HC882_00325 [Acidobacteria bacterium]|nr:hypothetical protein [Acidobacteriota bacterium]